MLLLKQWAKVAMYEHHTQIFLLNCITFRSDKDMTHIYMAKKHIISLFLAKCGWGLDLFVFLKIHSQSYFKV